MAELQRRIENSIRERGTAVAAIIHKVPYRDSGILPTEMLAFCCLCLDCNVGCVLESGRNLGYSASILACFGWRTVSVEMNPLAESDAKLSGVQLVTGNGLHHIPMLAEQYRNDRVAILLDGPKGKTAFGLADRIREHSVFAAIHDTHQFGLHGELNSSYVIAKNRRAVQTMDHLEPSLSPFYFLDESAWRDTHASRDDLVKYGYNLAFIPGDLC